MNWLITGGCGFIGGNLCSELLRDNFNSIRIIDNMKYGVSALLERTPVLDPKSGEGLTWEAGAVIVDGDVRDQQIALDVCRGADVIIHLAANTGVGPSVDDPLIDLDINVQGTANYLMAAKENGVKRFVFASSGAPAGNVTPPIHEDIVPRPVSPYGASKLAGEAYCSAFYNSYKIETVALRFSNVYGPYSGSKGSVVAKMLRSLLAGDKIQVNGDGNQTRDFIFVGDLVAAIIAAVHAKEIGGKYFKSQQVWKRPLMNWLRVCGKCLRSMNYFGLGRRNAKCQLAMCSATMLRLRKQRNT